MCYNAVNGRLSSRRKKPSNSLYSLLITSDSNLISKCFSLLIIFLIDWHVKVFKNVCLTHSM